MNRLSDPGRTFAVLYVDGVPSRLLKITKVSEDYDISSLHKYERAIGEAVDNFLPSWSTVKIEGWSCCNQSPASIREHIDEHTGD